VLLWNTVGRLSTTITIVVVALFLTLALNPIVESITRRGARRGVAVMLVFVGLIAVFVLIGFVVVPPVISQGAELAKHAPGYLEQILHSRWVQDLD
jgi:predicted PurR-regulated permease PerM